MDGYDIIMKMIPLQSLYSEQYKQQQLAIRKRKNEINQTKYGNSLEYQRIWREQNKRNVRKSKVPLVHCDP
jgi:hypothetical protein